MSLMLIYIIIGTLGLVYFLVTLVLGEIIDGLDGLFDGDEFDVDADDGSPSFFSGRVIAAAFTGFGAAGVIGNYLEWGRWPTLLAALGTMVLLSAGCYFLVVIPLYRLEYSNNVSATTFVGLPATVVIEISPNHTGRVEFVDATGQLNRLQATTDGSETLLRGANVTIFKSTPSGVVVR